MLEGKIAALTSLQDKDSEALFRIINDPETVRLNAPFAPVHYANHVEWFDAIRKKPNLFIFAIRSKYEDGLIGTCQLFDVHPVHRSAELQIRLSKPFWGKGYGSDAVHTLLRFAERDAGLHSVWLKVFSDNARAIRCYEKAGMKVTGTLPEYAFIDGTWRDMLVMTIVFGSTATC
jgi:RimJ/RimL family protein N-acetyltransferase